MSGAAAGPSTQPQKRRGHQATPCGRCGGVAQYQCAARGHACCRWCLQWPHLYLKERVCLQCVAESEAALAAVAETGRRVVPVADTTCAMCIPQ